MNSLEFIEFYIKEYKRSVEWYKKYQEKNPTSFVNTLKEEELILHHLQQIKSILEAWEVVKNKGVDMLIFMLYYDNLEEYNNYIKSLEGEYNYEKCLLTQNEADTIKKALEGENE